MNKIYNKSMQSVLFAIIFFLLLSTPTKADRRYFGLSYLAYTPAARELELELWQASRIGKESGSFLTWQPQIEFEYGVTNRLAASFYANYSLLKASGNNFSSSPLSFESVSLELRYRLTNQNEYFLDPAVYFEITKGSGFTEYEPKLILSKRIDNFISALNVASAVEKNSEENETESELEITFGLGYEITNNFFAGLELRHTREYEEFYDGLKNNSTFIGPTLGYDTGEINFVLSILAQVSGNPASYKNLDLAEHERYEIRLLASVEL